MGANALKVPKESTNDWLRRLAGRTLANGERASDSNLAGFKTNDEKPMLTGRNETKNEGARAFDHSSLRHFPQPHDRIRIFPDEAWEDWDFAAATSQADRLPVLSSCFSEAEALS